MINDIKEIKKVDMIAIHTGLEAPGIRAILESFGLQTRMHDIGHVQHLVSLLQSAEYLYETVILCCHGDHSGLYIPELSPELEKYMPYHQKLTSKDLTEFLNLNRQTIINTGCCLGRKPFADSFLVKGAKAYLGITDYIEGSAIIPFITNLFYFQFCKHLSLEIAVEKAKNIDEQTAMFQLYKRIL